MNVNCYIFFSTVWKAIGSYFAKSDKISDLERVELDKFERLCNASSILSLTVVGLDATMSSYSILNVLMNDSSLLQQQTSEPLLSCFRRIEHFVRTNNLYVLSTFR